MYGNYFFIEKCSSSEKYFRKLLNRVSLYRRKVGHQKNSMKIKIMLVGLFFAMAIISCKEKVKEKPAKSKSSFMDEKVQFDDPYVDFSMKNQKGELEWISDLRGEYTLLEFWASWCTPCRSQNEMLVDVYKKYNSKGLKIIGISLDRKKKEWLKAIEEDHLSWDHLSELKGWSCSAMASYYDRGIPFNYLIGPKGKIIGRKLHPLELERVFEILIDYKNIDELHYLKTKLSPEFMKKLIDSAN